MMKPVSVIVTISWDNGAEEEVELDINDKLEIKHKGSTISVRGDLKVEEEEESNERSR